MRRGVIIWLLYSLGCFNLLSCQQSTPVSLANNKDSFYLIKIPKDQLIFFEKQPAVVFWRKVISLTKDSCIVVHKESRQCLDIILGSELDSMLKYSKLDMAAQFYRDKFGYDSCDLVKFVRGKKEHFNFATIAPLIDEAATEFNHYRVNPIYAQFILLIESPNNPKTRSISGAMGYYQLMPFVARKYGLVITSQRDDRHDFAKSSMAAARLMAGYCIPNARRISILLGLEPDENQLWFQLLVMHIYNAGAGNVSKAAMVVGKVKNGEEFIIKLWKTQVGAFGNSSQNYSQLVLASYLNYTGLLKK